VDHDEEFHQAVVDVAGRRGLDDVDIFVSDGFADCDRGFLVGVVEGCCSCYFYAEPDPSRVSSSNSSIVASL
jgi:hypothetical protein